MGEGEVTDEEVGCFCIACDNCICEEFKRSNLGLDYPKPRDMVTCQWAWPEWIYLTWKIGGALYFCVCTDRSPVWIVLSGVWQYDWASSQRQRIKWFIYLTNWTFVLFTAQLIMQTATASLYRVHVINADKMTALLKVQWVLYNVATTSGFVITAAFWILLSTGDPHPVDIHSHGINCLYVVVDVFITAQPMRLLHVIHTECFFIVYCLFSLIYHFAGGTNAQGDSHIYNALDWNDSGTVTIYILIFVFLLIPIIYSLQFSLFKLRLYIKGNLHQQIIDHELT